MKKYIPDSLAIFRIISAPVILYLILLDGSNEGLMLIPAIIAFISAWTDFFDGRLARKWNVTTKTGAFLDTIADKIFITFIFIGFTYIDRVSIWITTLLIVREFIMIPPSKFGKAKASLQFWAVGFVMIDFQFNILSFNIADLVVLHALIFSYISGYQYISGYIQKTK